MRSEEQGREAAFEKTFPDHIWLDVGEDAKMDLKSGDTFRDLHEVTWSEDNATGYGVKYVRAPDAGEAEAVDCGEYGHAEGACGNAQCSPRRLTDAQIDKIRFSIPTKAVTQRDFELARAIEAALSPTPSDNRQQYAKEGESYVEGVNVERLAQALRALGMRSWDSLEEAPAVMSDAVNRLTRNVIKYVLTPPPATPAVAVQAEPVADPLQGAADWLNEAIVDCRVSDLQTRLMVGYNRASRLLNRTPEAAHPKPAAQSEPVWCDACSQMVSTQCPSGMCEMKKGIEPERQDPLSRTREEHSPGLASSIVRWKNLDAAMADPLFQSLRGVMGTANHGQDEALFRVLSYFEAAHPKPAAQSEVGPMIAPECVGKQCSCLPGNCAEAATRPERAIPAAPATAEDAVSDAEIVHIWDTRCGYPTENYPLTESDVLHFARAVLALRSGASAQHADERWWSPPDSFAKNWLTNGAALHPATVNLVVRFARAMAEKLAAAEVKYGYSDGWRSSDWMDECRGKLMEHIAKGDPRDVAAYCAFLWHHDASTAGAAQHAEGGASDA